MDKRLTRRTLLKSGVAVVGGPILPMASAASLSKRAGLPWPGCLSCHGPQKVKANVASGMTCNPCHIDPH